MSQIGIDKLFTSAIADVEARYNAERDKRLNARPNGEAQFIDLTTSDKYKHLGADPWIDPAEHLQIPETIDVSKPIKYLIAGGGFSGLLFAVRLIGAGVNPEELVIVESGGGFGGVWYWNRYPGLMCDVESYIYMPLLEETGYMPKHKYSYGPELRGHANRIADLWHLRPRTLFRQQVKKMDWDASKSEWVIKTQFQGDDRGMDLTLHVQYPILTAGQLTHPKIPDVEGLEKFKGHIFHTSRWDYNYTGGSTDDAKPELTNLKDKTVGIIGTGATAVQAIPELAKWAKKLIVIQRTPSSVDARNQRETDPEEWKKITSQKDWWRDRNANFADILHRKEPAPAQNLVSDGWINGNWSYCTAWGYDHPLTADQVPDFVHKLHVDDVPRAERIRKRVDEIVQDPGTAQKLKHWYPSWCKRPCFHDNYLPAFNKPNVTLIDTDGHGIDRFTERGVVANGEEVALDLLVLSTGYKAPGGLGVSPGVRYGITITGQDGANMDDAFEEDVSTLFGLCRKGFPNLFFAGVAQVSLTANQIHSMDTFARQIAYILTTAQRRAGASHVVVEPTRAAEEDWGDRVAAVALGMSGMTGCTPNYLNMEGQLDKLLAMGPEVQAKTMRSQIWGRGINNYIEVLDNWKQEGDMKGIEVKAAAV